MSKGVHDKTQKQRQMFRRFLSADQERDLWKRHLFSESDEVSHKAFALWNAYTYGKPLQPTEVSGSDGGPVKIEFVT